MESRLASNDCLLYPPLDRLYCRNISSSKRVSHLYPLPRKTFKLIGVYSSRNQVIEDNEADAIAEVSEDDDDNNNVALVDGSRDRKEAIGNVGTLPLPEST